MTKKVAVLEEPRHAALVDEQGRVVDALLCRSDAELVDAITRADPDH
jgi:hypothetical protein